MKISKNISLLIVLGVLVLLAWGYQGPFKSWMQAKAMPKNFFSSLNFNKIDKIEIVSNGKKTELVKVGESWRVAGGGKFELSKETVDQLMDSINKAKSSKLDLVSTKKDRQEDMGMNKSGTEVKLLENNKIQLNFKIGRLANDFQSTYVASEVSDNTYKLQSVDLVSVFARPDWRDTTIFNLAGKSATGLRLQYPGKELKLTPKGADWVDGKILYKQDSVATIINQLLVLSASQIPEQNFKIAGLEKPTVIAQVKGADFDKTLIVGKKKGDEYFAKTSDSDNIYLIPKAVVEVLVSGPLKK